MTYRAFSKPNPPRPDCSLSDAKSVTLTSGAPAHTARGAKGRRKSPVGYELLLEEMVGSLRDGQRVQHTPKGPAPGGALGDTAEGTVEGRGGPRTRLLRQGLCLFNKGGKAHLSERLACKNSSEMSFLAKGQRLQGSDEC